MLEIRIGYGDIVSEQMGIPMSASDFEAAKKILDEGKAGNQPVTVRSLVSPVQPLSEMITGMDYGDETMRKELDFLGSRLRHMTRKEQDIFSVALKLETPGTLKEIINLSYNLDSYDLLEDISDPGRIAAELLRRGKQIEIPEVLYPMLDFERIRDSYFADHKGDDCPSGLVLKRENTVYTEVYVDRWGDQTRGGIRELWTDIRKKSHKEKINLAIVRIKEEQDFLDNTVIKYIEVLNDLHLLDEVLYLKIKYGTDDKLKVLLVKNGLSLGLANLVADQYSRYLKINYANNTVKYKDEIIEKMQENDENEVLIYEMQYFIEK